MIEVEVPEHGTVVVQQGEVHEVREFVPRFAMCWCKNGLHGPSDRHGELRLIYGVEAPHMIGFQQFELAWEITK